MKLNNTGDEHPSISFTNNLDYAKYYASAKGGKYKMVILRTILTNDFIITQKIKNNKGVEYVTFKPVPSSNLEILTVNNEWKPLEKWNVIYDEEL